MQRRGRMMFLGVTLIDDRDVRRRAPLVTLPGSGRRFSTPLPTSVRREIWRRLSGEPLRPREGLMIIAAALAAPVIIHLVFILLTRVETVLPPGRVARSLLPVALVLVPAGATLPMWVYLSGVLYRRRITRTMAGMGRCAFCGYELGGLVPEADGCRVCPECGGAWRDAEATGAATGRTDPRDPGP